MGGNSSLVSFVGRRLLITIPLLVLISLGVFSLIFLIPGNPALTLAGGAHATPAEVAKISRQLHLNEPFIVQYWNWLKGVLHGQLGNSLFQNASVSSGIALRFPVTFSVAVGGMAVRSFSGCPRGSSPGSGPDRSSIGW